MYCESLIKNPTEKIFLYSYSVGIGQLSPLVLQAQSCIQISSTDYINNAWNHPLLQRFTEVEKKLSVSFHSRLCCNHLLSSAEVFGLHAWDKRGGLDNYGAPGPAWNSFPKSVDHGSTTHVMALCATLSFLGCMTLSGATILASLAKPVHSFWERWKVWSRNTGVGLLEAAFIFPHHFQ